MSNTSGQYKMILLDLFLAHYYSETFPPEDAQLKGMVDTNFVFYYPDSVNVFTMKAYVYPDTFPSANYKTLADTSFRTHSNKEYNLELNY